MAKRKLSEKSASKFPLVQVDGQVLEQVSPGLFRGSAGFVGSGTVGAGDGPRAVLTRRGKFQLKKLESHHVEFCRLRAAGYPSAMAAQKVGANPETGRKWAQDALIRAEIKRQQAGGVPTIRAMHVEQRLAEAAEAGVENVAVYNEIGQVIPVDMAAEAQRGLADLFYFAKFILGYDWLEERIHGPLCKLLQDPATLRAVVMLPRGWLKSTVCSIAFPIWRACRDPNVRILIVQNTMDNAELKLQSIASHFEDNEKFKTLYPHLLPTPQCVWQNRKRCLPRTKHHPEPTFSAAGVRTRVVSRHYDVIIEDDTAAPELDDLGDDGGSLLPTADQVKQAIGWHGLAQPLLTDMQKGMILIVGTRWFEHDLISHIHNKFPNYLRYERAALEKNGVPDPDGEPVWPERFPLSTLAELKTSLGPYFYSALYLNNPISSNDLNFKQEWIKYYTEEGFEKLVQAGRRFNVYTTVDLANDPAMTKGVPDWNVVITTAKDMQSGDIYVREYVRERCGPKRLIEILMDQLLKHNPIKVGIETIGYQRTIMYAAAERMAEMGRHWLIEPLHNNKQSKEARIMGLQPAFADGKIHIQRKHASLEQELLVFPRGKHDDIIDALSMQLVMWGRTWGGQKQQTTRDNNPFLLDNIIKGIQNRLNPKGKRPVMDVLQRNRMALA